MRVNVAFAARIPSRQCQATGLAMAFDVFLAMAFDVFLAMAFDVFDVFESSGFGVKSGARYV